MYSMRTLLCTSTNVWKVTYICCSEPLTASSDGTNDLRCTQPGSITRCKKHATHRLHHKLHRHMVFLCAMLLPYICVHKSARRWALCTRTVVFLEIHIDLGYFTDIYPYDIESCDDNWRHSFPSPPQAKLQQKLWSVQTKSSNDETTGVRRWLSFELDRWRKPT